jgi:hypothetical protein
MRLFLIFAGLLVCNLCSAAPDPPPPIPPPVGLPIDNGVTFFFVISLLFGCYKIYTYKKRASIL